MADKDTHIELKKRARRRLVGGAALALLAAVVLPLVMDQEPKRLNQDVQIRIPNPDGPGSKLLSAKPLQPAASQVAAAPAMVDKPVDKPVEKAPEKQDKPPKAVDKPVEKPVEKPPEKPKAPAPAQEKPAKPEVTTDGARAEAILNGAEATPKASAYLVQVGVYTDPARVKRLREKIKGEGYATLVEPLETDKGPKSRLKAGPFSSKEAALKAQEKLKRIGLGDSVVVPKP